MLLGRLLKSIFLTEQTERLHAQSKRDSERCDIFVEEAERE
jgi:hypothetical protein